MLASLLTPLGLPPVALGPMTSVGRHAALGFFSAYPVLDRPHAVSQRNYDEPHIWENQAGVQIGSACWE